MLKIIINYAKKYKFMFAAAEICIIILYANSLILPWNLTRLIDKVIYGKKYYLLENVILVYCILFLISTATNLIYAYIWQTLNNRYVVKIKTDMYEKLLRSKAKYLSNLNTGDAVARVEWDSDQFIHVVQKNVFHFINSILMCIAILVLICKTSIVIGFIAIISVIMPFLITKILSKKTEEITEENRNNSGILAGKVFEIFSGFREVKLFNAQLWAEKQIIKLLEKVIDMNNKQNLIALSVQKIAEGINLLCAIALYCYSAYMVVNGDLTIGVFLAVVQYVTLLNYKFDWILAIYNDWHWRKISIKRCCEILDCETEENNGIHIEKIDSIEFKNITFAYDDRPVLSDISFKIERGENIGLVGVSGVGKTTLISLLTKLYEPQSGEILINGVDISDINTYRLRSIIGIVSQDVRLFNDSIKYNLTLGKTVNNDVIEKALEKSRISKAVFELPQQLETIVGGNGLSGGQMQRVMMARMLIKNADMYICDEATSALDIGTESKIADELKEMLKGKIGITISHRYQSLASCDKIVVLKDGKIDSIGTDGELLTISNEYRILFGGVVHS